MKNVSVNRSDLKKLIDYVYEDEARHAAETAEELWDREHPKNKSSEDEDEFPEDWASNPEDMPAKYIKGHIFEVILRLCKAVY